MQNSNTPHNDLSVGYRAGQEDSEAWRLLTEHMSAFDAFMAIDDSDERLNLSTLEEIRAAIGASLRLKSSFERIREALAKRNEARKGG